jgi:hypothetical protein
LICAAVRITMKLYKISQYENVSYDTYDSAVVCAPDEETARNMDPSPREKGKPMEWGGKQYTWCDSPEQVYVEYLGVADPELEQGIVCASYNAG